MVAYYGGVERMDKAFGNAIALIEAAGALDSTVVVYTGDNGWQMPRGLANCYDTGTRVPLAIRWGDKLPAGSTVDDFVSLTDLAPTFLELAGLKPTPEMTGHSFVDLLRSKPSAVPRDRVFVERERHANVRRGNLSYPIRGIRTRGYLYLWNLRPTVGPPAIPTCTSRSATTAMSTARRPNNTSWPIRMRRRSAGSTTSASPSVRRRSSTT